LIQKFSEELDKKITFDLRQIVYFIDNKCPAMYVLAGFFHLRHDTLTRAAGVNGKTNRAGAHRAKDGYLRRNIAYNSANRCGKAH
jgi:hypothetical protein